MKYIVAEVEVSRSGGVRREMVFAFPNEIVHSKFASICEETIMEHGWRFSRWVSGGDIDGRGVCSGLSETMGLVSRGAADTLLWNMMDYGGGYVD